MVKIRLWRAGVKKRPFYRIVAIDERRRRNGRPLEFLGSYDPFRKPPQVILDKARLDVWRANGARLSDAVRTLARRAVPPPEPKAKAKPGAGEAGAA